MSRATTLTLTNTLAGRTLDVAHASRYYDEAVIGLAQAGWLAEATHVAVTAGTAQVAAPDAAVRILEAAYDGRCIPVIDVQGMESIHPSWRDAIGTPVAHVIEDETNTTIRLYPIPDVTHGPASYPHGTPLGQDFPGRYVTFICAQTRIDCPDWMDLPIALAILAREYVRETAYRDASFAGACDALAKAMLSMLS